MLKNDTKTREGRKQYYYLIKYPPCISKIPLFASRLSSLIIVLLSSKSDQIFGLLILHLLEENMRVKFKELHTIFRLIKSPPSFYQRENVISPKVGKNMYMLLRFIFLIKVYLGLVQGPRIKSIYFEFLLSESFMLISIISTLTTFFLLCF